jgi:hypothetical protein
MILYIFGENTMTNWTTYTKDLNIPKDWKCTSYGNDALPSYQTQEDNYKAYHIWIDSHDLEERKINCKDIYGTEEIKPRFSISLCYGYLDGDLFQSDNFEDVIKWIDDNPKTEEQIKLTKEYI